MHIERIAFEAVEDLANDGVVYAEIRFAPELHNMPFAASTEAICAGFRRAEESARARGQQISAHLIICAMRTEHRSVEVVEFVDQYRNVDSKVVAFDLAGAETGWPPSLHAEALTIARQRHINLTIHASEPPDLELISDALAHGAHRIGHGVRLDRDTNIDSGELILGPLATFIRDRQVHLEMAPTCNTQIGAVASVGDHPVIPFLRSGLNVGVNTDNRLMSDVSPSSELIALNEAHHLSWDDISRLVTNAISSGFAPLDERQRILNDIVSPAYSALANG
ncbi:MAG: adenosine deaminase [Actinobacteria bacterium]|nr:adenosine deaminase [Actinomycetota bacterium]